MQQKVAIIDPLGAHGSAQHFYSFGQAEGLSKNNVVVRLYSNNETNNPNIKNVKFYCFYKDIFSSKSKFISGFRWILGSIKSIFHARISGFSIFHFHVFNASILIAVNIILTKILFGKVVLTIHDVNAFSGDQSSKIVNLMYKLSDLLLTHNQFSKKEIQKIKLDFTLNIHIVPHGNYIPFIKVNEGQSNSRRHLDIANNKKVLLFFGMIKKVKGLEILLNSLGKVVDKHPDVLLVIAGKVWKNDFKLYQEIIDKYDLQEYCLIRNTFIPQEEVDYYYSSSDLVVLPYTKIYQSGVLMMALSYKKPVLVSDLDPFKEIISDNDNGFIFKSEDSESLSNKLIEILSDKKKLEKVKINGNKMVVETYGWNNIGLLTKQAYKTIF